MTAKGDKPVKPLSGGNPQIAKGYGADPVQAYIAAMPGWKSAVGARIDALIVKTIPNLTRAVKWNSPFYGVEGRGYFMGVHVFSRYIKLAFFEGVSLDPMPPDSSKNAKTRYLNIHEGDELNETQLADWFRQAAALPGYLAPKN
jgi:hypothetical protein